MFLNMSGCQLVCMCNKSSHPHIYIQALTVHLFVFETAPCWLLFAPSGGVKGEVMIKGGSLVGRLWWGAVRSLGGGFPSEILKVGVGGGGGKKSATQREVEWRCCCQSTGGTKTPQ